MHNKYIYDDYQNKGYALGLALDRRSVSGVNRGWPWDLLLYEYLLLVLFYDPLVLLIAGGHVLHQLVLYIHAMMIQQFSI
jgi:hypothetical protein